MHAIVKRTAWYFLALLIVASGFVGFQVMGALKEPVQAQPAEKSVPLVSTAAVGEPVSTLPVRANGFVRSAQRVDLAPQTQGQLARLSTAVTDLSAVNEGDVLAQLDSRTQLANVVRAEADLASRQASLNLVIKQLERSRQLVSSGAVSPDQIDQLEAQRDQARAALGSAEAALQSAQVALELTEVRAPFTGRVLTQHAELGQVVSPSTPIVTLHTPRNLEVDVSLTERELGLFPALLGDTPISGVLENRIGDLRFELPVTVAKVGGQIDARTRTLPIVLQVTQSDPRLLPNAYVSVRLDSPAPSNTYAVPASAVRDRQYVWQADVERLKVTPVDVIQLDGDTAFIRGAGLDQFPLVLGPLDAAVEGMAIRVSSPAIGATP